MLGKVLIALSFTVVAQAAVAQTPRERYISSFDYSWDMKSERPDFVQLDAPYYGRFTVPQLFGLDDCSWFGAGVDCRPYVEGGAVKQGGALIFSEKRQEDQSNDIIGEVPWALVYPYRIGEIFDVPSDWATFDMCNGPFKTLHDGWVFYGDNRDDTQLETELALSERVFTAQFLASIGADPALKAAIDKVGLLTYRANEQFRNAWLSGRLKRPAVVLAMGECGDGGKVVTLSFKEPTARFQIIPDFDYLLCQRYGLDPWNADQCPHVRDRLNNLQVLSGQYRVKITRKSGAIIYREIDIDEVTDTKLNM